MEFTQEQISEIISEITNGGNGYGKNLISQTGENGKVSERRGQGDMTYPGQDGGLSGEMPSVPSVFPSISVCPVFCGP